MGWTVREVSELTGIPLDSLRYYDREGLVSPKRGRNKYRYYDERDLLLLQHVVTMKFAQFSLSEIKAVFRQMDEEPSPDCSGEIIDMLRGKRGELESKIAVFQEIITVFDEMVEVLEGKDDFEEKHKFLDKRIQEIFTRIRFCLSYLSHCALS